MIASWLLRNIVPIFLGSLVAGLIGYGWNSVAISRLERIHGQKIEQQRSALVSQCEADKKITQEVSSEYQKNLAARDAALDDARRMLQRKCPVKIVTQPATGHNDATCEREPPRQDDRDTWADANALLDLASEAEKYRLQLIGCQDFVNNLK